MNICCHWDTSCRLWQGSLSPPSPLLLLFYLLWNKVSCRPGLELATQARSFCLWLPSARVQKRLPSHPTQSLNSLTFHVQHRKTEQTSKKLLYVTECFVCIYVCAPWRPEEGLDWSYKRLWANMWVLTLPKRWGHLSPEPSFQCPGSEQTLLFSHSPIEKEVGI